MSKQPIQLIDFQRIEDMLAEGVDSHYRDFRIRKSGGKTRKISAPDDKLKALLKDILDVLQPVLGAVISSSSWGFVKGRNIIGHAALHRKVSWGNQVIPGKRWDKKNKRPVFLNLTADSTKDHIESALNRSVPLSAIRVDLSNAFHSIDRYSLSCSLLAMGLGLSTMLGLGLGLGNNIEKIVLSKKRPIFYNIGTMTPKEFYTKIAAVCCYRGVLPQGAPTSPMMLNIALTEFDRMLIRVLGAKFARRYNVSFLYSRFADDMILSCNKKGVAKRAIPIIDGVCRTYGLTLNRKKTLIMSKHNGVFITGINVINGPFHMSTSRRNRNKIRAAIHQTARMTPSASRDTKIQSIKGRIAHVMSVDMAHGAKLLKYAQVCGVLDPKDKVFGVSFTQVEELLKTTSELRRKLWS